MNILFSMLTGVLGLKKNKRNPDNFYPAAKVHRIHKAVEM